MKSPRKPIEPSQDESRRTNVLMERMLSEFRTFGESLSIVRERVDRMEPKLDQLVDKVDLLQVAVLTLKSRLDNFDQRIGSVETKLH